MYDFQIDDPDRFAKRVRFLGRMEHRQVISLIKAADYSLIVREQNRVTLAGFPTKFVESISCGTPVIATDSSDLSEYIGAYNCGRIVSFDNLKNDLEKILSLPGKPSACNDLFDYRRYAELMDEFIRKVKRNRNYGSVLEPKTQI
jgi:glycosyltransferase involved in cell wall biosynthesis